MILAGDIGGTKTHLAVFAAQQSQPEPLVEEVFSSAAYATLEDLVAQFLSQIDHSITTARFGVAGPVLNGRAELTNLPWKIDEDTVQARLNLSSVRLLNDLEAAAYAIPILEPSDLHTLNAGTPVSGGNIAIIAPGTGLGEAFLTWDGARYLAYASEGGHASFAPANETELDMLRYLYQHYDHVSYERVCSGIGIPNIYAYYRDSGYAEQRPDVVEQLAASRDHTPIIVTAALDTDNPCPLCQQALKTFIAILGSEAGNMALKVFARSGVYLGGGIPPRMLSALSDGTFLRAFRSKGRFTHVLDEFPVHVILNSKTALLGAAHHGKMNL